MNEQNTDTGPGSSPPARSASPATTATGYPRSGVSGQTGTEATIDNRTPTPMATGQSGGTPDLSPGVVEIDTAHRNGTSETSESASSSESGSAPAGESTGAPIDEPTGEPASSEPTGEPASSSEPAPTDTH